MALGEESQQEPRRSLPFLEEALSLLQTSDTFRLVTTEGAARLATRAAERKQIITTLGGLAEQTTKIADADFHSFLESARAQADAQEKLAGWLKRLGGDRRPGSA